MYVFVREDLSAPQQAVQSCHACIEAASTFSINKLHDHPSVIICGAKNEDRLHHIKKYLIDNGIQHVHFYEPDLDNELTSIATEPLFGDQRKLFRKFQLIRVKGGA